jgi:hypothetical protein
MSKLTWDGTGERYFETGVSNGVIYPKVSGAYPLGHAWNGLVGVTEKPSGGEPNAKYADNIKYLNLMSDEEFEATIEAYTYPEAFAICEGSVELATGVRAAQQVRKEFGLVYKTRIGNDEDADDKGYKLHLVYGAMASPSEKSYETVNETPDAITFSWDITTTPEAVTGKKPTAHIVIDSTLADADDLAAFELVLFGDTETDPNLPLPDAVATAFAAG